MFVDIGTLIYILGGFFLNCNAFFSTIEMLGDQEQVNYWNHQVLNGKVLGGYGQTEIGHGSDVKSLETTAIYNEEKECWVVTSPKASSSKFWVGVLGHFATHLVIQARAIVKGKFIGIQTFVIEVRDR